MTKKTKIIIAVVVAAVAIAVTVYLVKKASDKTKMAAANSESITSSGDAPSISMDPAEDASTDDSDTDPEVSQLKSTSDAGVRQNAVNKNKTTYVFAGKLFASSTGSVLLNYNPIGKKAILTVNKASITGRPNSSAKKGYVSGTANQTNVGIVKGLFYNVPEKTLYFKILSPATSQQFYIKNADIAFR